MKQLFVAWTSFQRRQASMAPHCGFELAFLPIPNGASIPGKVLAYARNSWKTLQRLRRGRPDVIWVQLPQVPLMWVALIYRALFNRDAIVIADCHNAMFRPPWSRVPFGISLLSRCDLVIAHNNDIMATAVRMGVSPNKAVVIEDPPATIKPCASQDTIQLSHPAFMVPASFSPDEPIAELVAAASECSNVSFLITGNTRRLKNSSLLASAPSNVQFLGFLPLADFESILLACDAVVAFTKNEEVQLSACGEAVGAGKPMLISDTETLRALFPRGNVFVDSSSPASIKAGVQLMTDNLAALSLEARNHCSGMLEQWKEHRWQPVRETICGLFRQGNTDWKP